MIIKIYNKYKEIINYLVFGVLTTLINLITYYILISTIFNPDNKIELQITNIIAWITSVTFAYITNKHFVFNSKEQNIKKEVIKFCSSRISTLLVEIILMYIFVSTLKYNDKIIKIITNILVIILNYIISKLLVFKKRIK